MAGEWLKFECSLPEKPETLAITVAMGWDDPDLTVGKLMRLFRWFDQHTVDGNAPGVTPALLDRLIGVTGFVQAVANAGWMSITDGGLALNHFDRHNGMTAKNRAQTAKRVANHRASSYEAGQCNDPTVTSALAREEKKREEVIQRDAGKPAARPYPEKQKPRSTTLAAYIDVCRAAGVKPIPDDHPVRRYCESAGITPDMAALAWLRFREEHTIGTRKAKRYTDWPATFANSVKDRWYKFWIANTEGDATWTSEGLQARRVVDAQRHPEPEAA